MYNLPGVALVCLDVFGLLMHGPDAIHVVSFLSLDYLYEFHIFVLGILDKHKLIIDM